MGHLDVFAWVGAISGAPNTKSAAQLIPDPKVANAQLKLLFMMVGDADGLLASNKALHEDFTARGINHLWQVEPGIGHETAMWQRTLYNFAPRLFKGINPACSSLSQNGTQVCCDTASDSDGDGWGKENNQSCVMASALASSSNSVSKSSASNNSSTAAAPAPAGDKKSGGSVDFMLLLMGAFVLTFFRKPVH